jgi:hypothetical protein
MNMPGLASTSANHEKTSPCSARAMLIVPP